MSSSAAVNSSSAGSSSSDHHPPCSSSPSSRLHPLTFWCHECEMSVSLLPSPSSPLLCPDCLRFDSLLPLDSPFPPSLIPFFPSHPSPDLSPANPTPESDSDSPRPLPAESIAAIPTVEIHDAAALCAICKDGLIPQGSPARCLPCSHLFHSDCIVPWLNLRNSCPLCRSSIPFLREPADRIDIHLEAPLRRMLASSARMGMEETGSVETVTSEWRINGDWGGLEEAEVADAMYDVWEDVFA